MAGKENLLQRSMKIRGIRKRWMWSSVGVVLLIVVLAVVAFSLAMSSYYYTSMMSGLELHADQAAGYFTNYESQGEFNQYAQRYVSSFAEKNVLELQFITPTGQIHYSSSGLTAGTRPGTQDITLAQETHTTQSWTGRDPKTGERVMAVTSPILYNDQLVSMARVGTSLKAVDRQLVRMVVMVCALGAAIMAIVYFSNLFFVRSIVEPVARVTETARMIAEGSYGIQIEKRYDDEVGELVDAINDMSTKIAQSEKTQTEFISSVSHELRTPLTAINGWAETIMNGEVRDAGDVRKGMSIIVSEARRLTNMVEELLEFSRIEDGRFTLSMEPMDIKAELEDAVYTYKEFFRREGIVLEHTDCPEEFAPLSGDPQRLRQVFCNLLDNAAKHGGSGKRIETSIAAGDHEVIIKVRDFGPGIPESELPLVTQKFYKGSSKARGSGIGLAVCEEIVTRHGGQLEIGNAPGGGCVVTIHLPTGT